MRSLESAPWRTRLYVKPLFEGDFRPPAQASTRERAIGIFLTGRLVRMRMAGRNVASEIRLTMAIFPEILPQLDGADGPFSDENLMHEITQRRQQALKELYARYSRSLRALIGSVVHEESEADDVLQESFLQIWREAHHYSPKAGKPLGWVITIARRRAIDRVRRRDSYRRAKQRFENEIKPQAQSTRTGKTDAEVTQSDLRTFLG